MLIDTDYEDTIFTIGFESAGRMKEFTDEKGIPFWEITKEGESIEI